MACAKNWLVPMFALMVAAGARLADAQTAGPATLDWQPTHQDACRIAGQSNRFVLVHFYSPKDQACQAIEKDVYSQAAVRERIQTKIVPFKVNVDEMPLTAKKYGIDRVPTDLLLDANTNVVGQFNCPTMADTYVAALESSVAAAKARIEAAQTSVAAASTPAAAPPPYSSPPPVQSTVTQPAPAANVARYQPPAVPAATTAYNQGGAANAGTTAAQSPVQQAPQQPPAIPAYSDDRYAEFYKRWNASQQSTTPQQTIVSQATATQPQQAIVTQPAPNSSLVQAPATNPQPAATPPAWGTAGYFAQQNKNPNTVAASPYSTNPPAPSPTATTMPAGAAPLGFDGYCPVTMIEQNRWQVGDGRWGAIHRGRTYLFAGPVEQKQFMANPDRYSPAISGRDVVAAVDQGQTVDGQRKFGAKGRDGRMYLFSSLANRNAFMNNADRYSAEVRQAENPNRGTTWR